MSRRVGEVALGPWGHNIGKQWSFRPKQAANITQIGLRRRAHINSLMFTTQSSAAQFGGDDDAAADPTFQNIVIDFPSEFLTGISGTYDRVVTSLTFHTNKTCYGPYGGGGGTAFSVNAAGGAITGFHGSYGVGYFGSIGVYVMPDCFLKRHDIKRKQIASSSGLSRSLSLPRGAGPKGGNGGREWDDGVFSAVKGVDVMLNSSKTVSAVQFRYLRSDGSDFLSPIHGGYSGGISGIKKISFDKDGDEFLISIEGFYGPVKGYNVNVITSLSFITNKAKYGPIGLEIGTFFTFVNSVDYNGKVVGFHGRSGAYLDAIGLHSDYHMMNRSVAQKKAKLEK